MTITLSQKTYWDLFQKGTAAESDPLDVTWDFPKQLGQGYWREIQLREGIELAIAHYQLRDAVVMHLPERDHPLEYRFHLCGGNHLVTLDSVTFENVVALGMRPIGTVFPERDTHLHDYLQGVANMSNGWRSSGRRWAIATPPFPSSASIRTASAFTCAIPSPARFFRMRG